ncbi:endonuclease/exonuclease/phosphatase family protein [Cesiribacter sp. SM1]|uniref:endonuclease/exonuclease/phosphatase family protein n=1 Tax=Cesiribacter sp. SM1 TaxID=2861196 RepID=UPI001CD790CA|nr:endonuclease/exonuclease/phosphatase family protein [Cesiribacter sp. SM1]
MLWIVNLLWLLPGLIRPNWWLGFTVVAVVAGLGLVNDTVAFSGEKSPGPGAIKVLSYNVSHFNRPKGYHFEADSGILRSTADTRAYIDWVVNNTADIKCFQEFYTFSGSTIFNTDARLRQEGWVHSYISTDTLRINRSQFGVAIYSKYPIVDKGVLFIGRTGFNRGIWADVKIYNDTVRVVNAHLQSAQLQRILYKNKERGFKEAAKRTFWSFRKSQQERVEQLRKVLAITDNSPYPLIICGDLNSTPYSPVYQILDDKLVNAFEQEGSGFGFTFNHPKMFFLRIDHQFVSKEVEVLHFNTRQDVPFSAHFPTEGWYYFTERE